MALRTGHVLFLDGQQLRVIAKLQATSQPIETLKFSPDSKVLVSVDKEFKTSVYHHPLQEWQVLGSFRTHREPVVGILFSNALGKSVSSQQSAIVSSSTITTIGQDAVSVEIDLTKSSILTGLVTKVRQWSK